MRRDRRDRRAQASGAKDGTRLDSPSRLADADKDNSASIANEASGPLQASSKLTAELSASLSKCAALEKACGPANETFLEAPYMLHNKGLLQTRSSKGEAAGHSGSHKTGRTEAAPRKDMHVIRQPSVVLSEHLQGETISDAWRPASGQDVPASVPEMATMATPLFRQRGRSAPPSARVASTSPVHAAEYGQQETTASTRLSLATGRSCHGRDSMLDVCLRRPPALETKFARPKPSKRRPPSRFLALSLTDLT